MSSIVPDTENWLFNVTLLENLIQSAIISLIFFKFYFKSDLLLKIQLYSKTFIIFYNLKIFEITIVTKESPWLEILNWQWNYYSKLTRK